MTKKSKGDKAQKFVADYLRSLGYEIETPVRVRWHREDFFSCWDIIAIKENELRFIQVSTLPLYDRGVKYKKKLEDFPKGTWRKEYWQVLEGAEPRIWNL